MQTCTTIPSSFHFTTQPTPIRYLICLLAHGINCCNKHTAAQKFYIIFCSISLQAMACRVNQIRARKSICVSMAVDPLHNCLIVWEVLGISCRSFPSWKTNYVNHFAFNVFLLYCLLLSSTCSWESNKDMD